MSNNQRLVNKYIAVAFRIDSEHSVGYAKCGTPSEVAEFVKNQLFWKGADIISIRRVIPKCQQSKTQTSLTNTS